MPKDNSQTTIKKFRKALRDCKKYATEGADSDDAVLHHSVLRAIESTVENAFRKPKKRKN